MSSARRRSRDNALRLVRNRLGRGRFARTATRIDDVPVGAVIVFFAAVPAEIFHLEQWAGVLARLGRPVVVVVGEPDIGRLARDRTGLPIVLATHGSDLEQLITRRRPAAVLYLNHRMQNFTMLRYQGTVHVYLGHGESDKDTSFSHQNMAYDYCFVAGPAGRERLAAAMPLFDAERRAAIVGRPSVDLAARDGERPTEFTEAPGRQTVLYAPTWEGGLPSLSLGSVVSHGERLVDSVLADPRLRLIYRPHPVAGSLSGAYAAADVRIRRRIAEAGPPHFVDTGPYGWVLSAADVAVVDVSSVAYDWLTTGRPVLITIPTSPDARPATAELYDRAPRLSAVDAGEAATVIHGLLDHPTEDWAELVRQHLGDVSPGTAMSSFIEALDRVAAR